MARLESYTAHGAVPADADKFIMDDDADDAVYSITYEDMVKPGWTQISGHGMASGQSLTAATPAKLTQYSTNMTTQRNATADQANGRVTAGIAGQWRLSFSASYTPIATAALTFTVYKNGSTASVTFGHESDDTKAHVHFDYLFDLNATDYLEVWVTSDTNGTLTLSDAALSIHCMGEAP